MTDGYTIDSRNKRGAKLRPIILEATLEILSHRGILGTSMDMVALEAKVTKRTIYHHFADKNDLIEAAVEYEIERIQKNILQYSPEDTGVLEQIKYFCQHLLPSLQEPRVIRFFSFLIFESHLDERIALQTRTWLHRGQKPLLRLMEDAVQKGFLKGNPEKLILLLTDMLIAGPLERLRMGVPKEKAYGGISLERFIEERWGFFLTLCMKN